MIAIAVAFSTSTSVAQSSLDGVTITSYAANGTRVFTPVWGGTSPMTLSLSSGDNAGFTPSLVWANSTGDFIEGFQSGEPAPAWELNANGLTAPAGALPGLLAGNFLAVEGESWGPRQLITPEPFQAGSSLDIDFILNFATPQRFDGLYTFDGSMTAATLTPSGGSAVDLMSLATGTVFTAGNYQLDLTGAPTAGKEFTYIGTTFAPVPEPSGLGLAAVATCASVAFWRRRRASSAV